MSAGKGDRGAEAGGESEAARLQREARWEAEVARLQEDSRGQRRLFEARMGDLKITLDRPRSAGTMEISAGA